MCSGIVSGSIAASGRGSVVPVLLVSGDPITKVTSLSPATDQVSMVTTAR